MSYITKDSSSMLRNQRNKIILDKDTFVSLTTFEDLYFANELNWRKIAIHFQHTGSTQRKIIILFNDSSQGWFEVSSLARTGEWPIQMIQIFDNDGDVKVITREDMPDPENFDIEVL
jgi:hypothetical protein